MRWRWLGIGVVLVVVAGVVGHRSWDPGWRSAVRGVDVSHHQGPIDWRALAADRTEFAYIKATEGGDWTDTRFEENWRGAAEAGLHRGAYHFFTLCTPGAAQAAHFIATVPVEATALPPAVDLELGGNCSRRPPVDEFAEELDVFLDAIVGHYRKQPVIYTNHDFYEAYLAELDLDVTWWIMSPVIRPWGEPDWTIWQYFPGFRDGVDGRIDRNAFRGSLEDFTAFAKGDV